MAIPSTPTLIVGAGQAGLALSAHLTRHGAPHLVIERGRVAERWRAERWDSLVANGPAWHDRFPPAEFADVPPDGFAPRDRMVRYFEEFARVAGAPLRTGVAVTSVTRRPSGGFRVDTSDGPAECDSLVAATGPFQKPLIPALVPADTPVLQLHSSGYRNPAQLPPGAVLVVGAGSSGVQIADELRRAGRRVFLSVGPHNRPPRRYRGRDYCYWLGVLGKWDAKAPAPGTEHVTIAVSGARGGHTVDFRQLAHEGITLLGRAEAFADGTMHFAPDLAANIARGDADYLSVLDEADVYAAREGLDLPEEPEARRMPPDPACLTEPVRELGLAACGISAIVWATGYGFDFGWLQVEGVLDSAGRPVHRDGVSSVPGLYFLGLPWLSNRSSSFIWGVWRDAERLAGLIAAGAAAVAA